MICPCPNCHGKISISPKANHYDNPCIMCNGQGLVDNEIFCAMGCGRPGVICVGEQFVCTTASCLEEVVNSKDKKSKNTECDDNWLRSMYV